MTGQWIRIPDSGWHRVVESEPIAHDIDLRSRLVMACRFVVLANPTTLMRGLPGAGAVICDDCASWKESE